MSFWSHVLGNTVLFLVVFSGDAQGTVFHSQAQALALAFPGADRIESETHILTEAEVEAIQTASRSEVPSRLVTIHRGFKRNELLGYAHIDVHTVRTKPEAFMVVLGPDSVVRQVRVLAFHEPLEYMPVERWYRGFFGKSRQDDLRIGFDVDAVAGATLTTRATVDSVRRMLAYYQVLLDDASPAGADSEKPPPAMDEREGRGE